MAVGAVLACVGLPVAGALVVGAFGVLFLAALSVMRLRGIRGRDAARGAYLFAFGWTTVL